MSYKSIVPRTQLQSYTPGVEVSWDLLHDMDESVVPGSVYITGEFRFETGAAVVNGTLEHFVDPHAGIAAFMENVITRCDAFTEVITNYGRLAKHNAMMQYSEDQLCAGIIHSGEMRAPTVKLAGLIVDACATSTHASGAASVAHSFTHKPLIALNNMSGALSMAKSGRIQVSFKCPSVQKCVFGTNAADLASYAFTNLQLHYQTTMQPAPQAVTLKITQDTQKLIQSSRTTVMNTFPDMVDKVLVSFADVETETELTQNSLVCQFPPISKVNWVYNSVSNGLVSYTLESDEEFVKSGFDVMEALGAAIDIRDKMAMAALDPVHSVSDKFALGLNLRSLNDFSRSGLGVTVEMQPGAAPRNYYAFFYAYGSKTI